MANSIIDYLNRKKQKEEESKSTSLTQYLDKRKELGITGGPSEGETLEEYQRRRYNESSKVYDRILQKEQEKQAAQDNRDKIYNDYIQQHGPTTAQDIAQGQMYAGDVAHGNLPQISAAQAWRNQYTPSAQDILNEKTLTAQEKQAILAQKYAGLVPDAQNPSSRYSTVTKTPSPESDIPTMEEIADYNKAMFAGRAAVNSAAQKTTKDYLQGLMNPAYQAAVNYQKRATENAAKEANQEATKRGLFTLRSADASNEYVRELQESIDATRTDAAKKTRAASMLNEKSHEIELAPYNLLAYNKDFNKNSGYKKDWASRITEVVNGAGVYDREPNSEELDLYSRLLPEEQSIYNYLLNTKGDEGAKEYLEALTPDLKQRRADYLSGRAYQWANKNALNATIASAGTVVLNGMRNVGTVGAIYDKLTKGTVNPNAAYNLPSQVIGAARQGAGARAGEDVSGLVSGAYKLFGAEEEKANKRGETAGKIAEWLYPGVMSSLDSAWNGLVAQTIADGMFGLDFQQARGIVEAAKNGAQVSSDILQAANKTVNFAENFTRIVMGAAVVPDAIQNAIERGYSDNQAFAIGMTNGLAEYISEAVSIGNLMETDWTKKGVKNFLLNQLKQRGSEALEEVESGIIDWAADILIGKSKSEWAEKLRKYDNDPNVGPEKAFGAALAETALETGSDALSAFLTTGNEIISEYGKQKVYQSQFKLHNKFNELDKNTGTNYVDSWHGLLAKAITADDATRADAVADYVRAVQEAFPDDTAKRAVDFLEEARAMETNELVKKNLGIMSSALRANLQNVQTSVEKSKPAQTQTAPAQTEQTEQAPQYEDVMEEEPSEIPAVNEKVEVKPVSGANAAQTNENIPAGNENIPAGNTAQNEAVNASDRSLNTAQRLGMEALNLQGNDNTSVQDAAYSFMSDIWNRTEDKQALRGKGIAKATIDNINARVNNAIKSGRYSQEQIGQIQSYANEIKDEIRNNVQGVQQMRVNLINESLKKYGVTVRVNNNMTDRGGFHTVDGKPTIDVNPFLDTEEALNSVVSHELTHYLRSQNRADNTLLKDLRSYQKKISQNNGVLSNGNKVDLYDDAMIMNSYAEDILREFHLNEAGKNAVAQKQQANPGMSEEDAIKALYADDAEKLWTYFDKNERTGETAEDYFDEECVSNFIEELGHDNGILEAIMTDDRNLFQRIVDAFRAMFKQPPKERYFTEDEAYKRLNDRLEGAVAKLAGEESGKAKAGTAQNEQAETERKSREILPDQSEFRMAKEIERVGDLVAVHNLDETKFLDTHELGGFPAPSIAVVKAKEGHSEFGPISVVFGSDTIDPQIDSRNRIYGGDAWTPTFPHVDYDADHTTAWNGNKAIYDLAVKVKGFTKFIDRYAISHALTNLENSGSVRRALNDMGHEPTLKLAYAAQNGIDIKVPSNQSYAALQKAINDAVPDATVREWISPFFNMLLNDRGIRNENYDPYDKSKSFSETHVPVTAENVVKAMYEQQSRRGEGIFADAEGISSLTRPEFRSMDEVRANKNALGELPDADYYRIVKNVNRYLADAVDDIALSNNGIDPSFLTEAILEAARTDHSDEAIREVFDNWGRKIDPGQIRMLQSAFRLASQLPTTFFEAKPERVVPFSEAMYYIIPNNSSAELRQTMEQDGVPILEYKADDEADRLKVLNSLKDVRFSRELPGTSAEDREIDSDYIKAVMSNDVAEQQAIVTLSARKHGYTVEAFHGTRQFGFTVPNVSKSDDGFSFFVTADLDTARTYSGMDSVLRINENENKRNLQNKELDVSKVQDDFEQFEKKLIDVFGVESDEVENFSGEIEEIKDRAVKKEINSLAKVMGMHQQLFDIVYELYGFYMFKPSTSSLWLGEEGGDDLDLAYDDWLESEDASAIEEIINEIENELIGAIDVDEREEKVSGNYHVYINTDGVLDVDGNGSNWNRIPFEIDGEQLNSTREIAKYAKENGYTGVLFRNIVDDGGQGHKRANEADVYALFEPQKQVRSADPITEENGYIVLPSQRFNPNQRDMRYSREINTAQTETEAFKNWFGDWQNDPVHASKVVNEDGTPKIMYRGDPNEINVFDRKKSKGSNLYGRGFYFTDSEANARNYGEAREYYLDVKNPLSPDQHSIQKSQMRKFLKAVQDNENYSFENYGENATVNGVLNDMWGKGDFEMLQDVSASAIGDLVEAIELFNQVNGTNYDGIIVPTETVVFNSNQIKSATDNVGTFDRNNPDVRYSREIPSSDEFRMSKEVERVGDLVAVHNMTTDQLAQTLESGGIPSPSTAVIKAKQGHSNYGPVSVVFRPESIDPEFDYRNRVYGADAYTPTYSNANVEWELKYDNVLKLEHELEDLSSGIAGGSYTSRSQIGKYYNDTIDVTPKEFAQRLAEKPEVKAAYLASKGENVEQFKKDVAPSYSSFGNDTIQAYIDAVGEDAINEMYDVENDSVNMTEEQYQQLRDAIVEYRANKAPFNRNEETKYQRANLWADKNLTPVKMDNIVRSAWEMMNNTLESKSVVDTIAIEEAIDKAAPTSEVFEWLRPKIEKIYGKRGIRNNRDMYTNSGSRRSFNATHDEYSLENIVRAMFANGSRGLNANPYSSEGYQSKTAQEYNSLDEIRADKDRLQTVNEEEYKEIADRLGEKITDIRQKIAAQNPAKDNYIAMSEAGDAMLEAASPNSTKAKVKSALRFYDLKADDATVSEILKLYKDTQKVPTMYFEAKPERVIGLDEIAAVIAPDSIEQSLRDSLAENNINTIEYEAGNEQSRLDALNSLPDDTRFSREVTPEQDQEYLDAVEAKDTEKERQMVDNAAHKAGYNIKAYHGTTEDFTEFLRSKQGSNHKGYLQYGAGFYFAPNKSEAEEWVKRGRAGYYEGKKPKVMSVYLSANKILNADDAVPEAIPSLKAMGVDGWDAQFIANRAYRLINYLLEDKGFTNAEVQEQLISMGYDAVEATYKNSKGELSGEYVVFDPTQIKSADPVTYDNDGNPIKLSERFNDAKRDIRYSKELGDDYAAYNRTVLLKEDTVDKYLKDYAAEKSPNYAQAYITRMSPKQFLALTSTQSGEGIVRSQTEPMRGEELAEAARQQPIQIRIEDGEVVGHEGRHRMVAMERNGIESVPVLVFDSSNKNNKTEVPEMSVRSQEFRNGRRSGTQTLTDLVPLSYANRDRIVSEHGSQPSIERLSEKYKGTQTMRFSKEVETLAERELRRKLQKSEEMNAYLKKQYTARTAFGPARAISPKAFNDEVRRMADLLKYSNVSVDEIRTGLRELFDIFERPLKGQGHVDSEEARYAEAEAKVNELVDKWFNAVGYEKILNPEFGEDYENYKSLYKDLTKVSGYYVKPQLTAEAGDAQSLARIRKKLAYMKLLGVESEEAGMNTGRRSIDQIYTDLAASYPQFFEQEGELASGEMNGDFAKLQRIADVGEVAYLAARDPYVVERDEMVDANEQIIRQEMHDDLMSRFWQLSKPTKASGMVNENDVREAYAEGQREMAQVSEAEYERGRRDQAKSDELEVLANAQREELMEQHFRDEFADMNRRMDRLYDEQMEKINRLESRIARRGLMDRVRAERNKLMRSATKLNKLLENPTRKEHIPQSLRAPVAKLLESIANYGAIRLPNGKTITAERMAEIQQQEAEAIRNAAREIASGIRGGINASDQNLIATENFLQQLTDQINFIEDIYNRMNSGPSVDKRLQTGDIATSQNESFLNAMNKVVEMAVHAINDANKFVIGGKNYTAAELGAELTGSLEGLKSEGYGRQKRSIGSGISELARDIGYETMSPDLFFGNMGWTDTIAHAYREGQNRQAKHEARYIEYMKNLLGDYDNMNAKRELIPVKINGKELNVTRDQLMQLYVTYQRPAGRVHLENGGACFVDDKGRESRAYTFPITPEIYNELMSHLTEEDKRIADGLVRFMANDCANWGNEASMYMYGYRMYEDPNYIPLDVVNYAIPKEIADKIQQTKSIENASFTNPLKRNSTVPLRMTSLFDVANDHVRKMAAYNAYAPITNDMNRIMRMTDVSGTVKDKLGNPGWNYLKKFVERVAANEVRTGEVSAAAAPLTAMMNAYKRQAVAWNVSTMLKQPISILRAANEIDGKYLRRANVGKEEYQRIKNLMLDRSGVAYIKSNGYSDTGLGKTMEKLYTKNYTNDSGLIRGGLNESKFGRGLVDAYDAFIEKGMEGAARADEMTWVRIWKACELEVADNYPNLSGEERLQKVTERFNDVIGKTQVVDTILDSAPLMQNKAMQIFTPFMNEPTKTLGGLVAAANDWRNGKSDAGKKFGKALGLWAVANILIEPLITSLMTMWRDEKDDTEDFGWSLLEKMLGIKKDKDGITWNGRDFFTSNMVSGALSLPIVNIIYNTISNKMQGFSSEKIDTAALSNLYDTTRKLNEGMHKAPADRAKSMYRLWGDWAEALAAFVGIPAKTIRRQIAGTARAAMDMTNSNWAKWQYNKLYYNMENTTARSQKNFYDILADTYKSGDAETYQKMLDELTDVVNGTPSLVNMKAIQSAIEKGGGEIKPGNDLWNTTVQARFRLDQAVKGWQVENFLTKTYVKAEKDGIEDSAVNSVLLNMPDSYDYEADGKDVEMTAEQYDEFTRDVGGFSYKVLAQMSSGSNSSAWNKLTIDQQIYAIDKVYAYSKAKAKKDINPDYDIRKQGVWMDECYSEKATPKEVSARVMQEASGYDKQKKRKK